MIRPGNCGLCPVVILSCPARDILIGSAALSSILGEICWLQLLVMALLRFGISSMLAVLKHGLNMDSLYGKWPSTIVVISWHLAQWITQLNFGTSTWRRVGSPSVAMSTQSIQCSSCPTLKSWSLAQEIKLSRCGTSVLTCASKLSTVTTMPWTALSSQLKATKSCLQTVMVSSKCGTSAWSSKWSNSTRA